MEHIVQTTKHNQMLNITHLVQEDVKDSGARSGIVTIFIPHTTAAVTINENADSDVVHDILLGLDKVSPDRREYLHFEGNSPAHIKASMMGSSSTIIIENGKLKLGTWQGIYFCEFDGPRTRKMYVKIIEGAL
ncbi:MAG TPA: YjbQ family protein [Clostridiales bacterium]|nr:YjbQ family protein [Clostridiales bacterium]